MESGDLPTESGLLPPMLLPGLFIAYIVYVLGYAIYNLTLHPLAKFPGTKLRGAFYFPDTWSRFSGTNREDIHELHKKYGPIVRITPSWLSASDPRAFKDIHGARSGKAPLPRDPVFYQEDKTEGLPPDIIFANNQDHARYRRALLPAFSEQALREQEPMLNHYFELLIERLISMIDQKKSKVDLVSWYNYTTFDIIGDLSLGASFEALEGGKDHPWMATIFKFVKFLRWLQVGGQYPMFMALLQLTAQLVPSVRKARATHMAFTRDRVVERFSAETDRKDFMTYIERKSGDQGLTRDEIVGNANILIIAGSETTATLLSGATYLLLQNPAKLARLQQEVRASFRSIEQMSFLTLGKLPYLHAVIEEALRMYPPVPGALMRRTPAEGAEVLGEYLPGGTSIGVHHWSTYRDPVNFARPDEFHPERFLAEPPVEFAGDNKQALQPFSVGPRGCIGRVLAYNEMYAILARMVFSFDFELCPESNNWTDQKTFTLWEKHPLMVQLRKRA